MLHKISQFCDKVDTIKKMSDELRVLKYQTPKSKDRNFKIQNLIETIQADCHLVSQDKSDYDNNKNEEGEYGDYSGITSYAMHIQNNKE